MKKIQNTPIRVLIIEDDPDILNALNIVLGSVGFDVDVLMKGQSILKNQFVLPDVFVIDKRLPDTDGLEICRYLKSKVNYKDTPVIIISASHRIKKKAFDAGADDFVVKPFVIQDLVNVIHRSLEKNNHVH